MTYLPNNAMRILIDSTNAKASEAVLTATLKLLEDGTVGILHVVDHIRENASVGVRYYPYGPRGTSNPTWHVTTSSGTGHYVYEIESVLDYLDF